MPGEGEITGAALDAMYWYHSIDLPVGRATHRTRGEYDVAPYLPKYGFPDDLGGKTVADVGAADGFFSFEFERRRARRIIAIDYDSGYPDVPFHEVARFGKGELPGGIHRFELAHRLLGSSVEHINRNIYDLDAADVGTFDLVFCGSVLLHLTDPLKALQGLRRITGDRIIVATAHYREPALLAYQAVLRRGMRLFGKRTGVTFSAFVHNEMDETYWIPTVAALLDMVERAGFRDARLHSTFSFDRTEHRRGWPHAVIHARV